MRTIKPTTRFRRDYKREKKGQRGNRLDALLTELIDMLAADTPLPPRYQDHALTGQWQDHRDCHVRPDLVLIYRKPDDDTLQLVRLGSHSELTSETSTTETGDLEDEFRVLRSSRHTQRLGRDPPHALQTRCRLDHSPAFSIQRLEAFLVQMTARRFSSAPGFRPAPNVAHSSKSARFSP